MDLWTCLAPLAAEVERLRKEVMHLPEAERENRCMLQELASEAAMVDVALSAHGDAEAMLVSRAPQGSTGLHRATGIPRNS